MPYGFQRPAKRSDDAADALAAEGSILNAYGRAFEEAHGADAPGSALAAIEEDDSDGDGTSNADEILTLPGFLPGYSCATYLDALNAPVDIASFVDPTDIGCGAGTTTTLGSVTTTTTVSTTTTTLGKDPVLAGQALYDSGCSGCHAAGSHDPVGFATDLAGKGGFLVNDLSTISSYMTGLTLTDQEIADLKAFLDSL